MRYALVALLLLTTSAILAKPATATPQQDSVKISLLTCQPGNEVYSLYGHTAIRYQDLYRGVDIVINYGMFNSRKPNFALRFIFGLTDYEMGIEEFTDFCSEYIHEHRGVCQQTLNLTPSEKMAIANAIDDNYKPENRVYRYNYFYDNCTTRARDILVNNINGTIKYDTKNAETDLTNRKAIHQWTTSHLWPRFGEDLLLGVKADSKINFKQRQFIPDNLSQDFDKAVIISNNGGRRNLVISKETIIPPSDITDGKSFPSPSTCAVILLVVTIAVTAIERLKKIKLWEYDALLMLVGGLAGIIITAMIFSEQPTVGFNLQILILNPLPLFFAYPMIKRWLKQRPFWYPNFVIALIVLFLIGNFFQDYAEGMNFVAVSLLTRCASITLSSRKK